MSGALSLLARPESLSFAVDAAVKALLLFAIAALAARMLRRGSPGARHRVWLLAFCGAIAVPLLSLIVPPLGIAVLPPTARDDSTGGIVLAPVVVDREEVIAPRSPDTLGGNLADDPAQADSPNEVAPAARPSGGRAPMIEGPAGFVAESRGVPVAAWLIAVWAAGLFASCLPLVRGAIGQRSLLARSRRVPEARAIDELCEQLGLRRRVRLFEVDGRVIPMTWGIVRPLVLLPAGRSGWNRERLRMVLLHELAHIARLDLPVQWFARVVCAVYWFNPLAWYAYGRLRDECEQACDDWVIYRGEQATAYAIALVDLAEAHYKPRTAAAVAMARSNRLEHRIRSIVDPRRSRQPLSRAWAIASLGVASVLVLAAVMVQPYVARATAEEPAPKAEATPAAKSQPDPSKPLGPGVDALGDALPEAALLRFGTLRFRPPNDVKEIALSPDEATLVTLGRELVIAWDPATGKQKWQTSFEQVGPRLMGSSYGARLIAFTPDSRKFYTPALTNEVMLWDAETGKGERIVIKPGNTESASPVAIDLTPDGQILALGNEGGVVVKRLGGDILYEITNNPTDRNPFDDQNRDRLLFSGQYSFVRLSPDGKRLAVVLSESPNEIRLLETESGELLRKINLAARLVRLEFAPDGKQVVTTERDAAARMYDVETGRRLWEHVVKLNDPYENYTSAVAYSPDALTIAVCASDYSIYLLNAADGAESGRLRGHLWKPWNLAFTGDGKTLYSSGWDSTIRRWDMATRTQLALPRGVHATSVCAHSPDGRTIAYADDRGRIRLASVPDGSEICTLELAGSRFGDLVFSPDGRQLAGGGVSGENRENVHVTIWDLTSAKVAHRWEWPEGRDPHSEAECLQFSPRGDRLAAAVFRQDRAMLWNVATGEQIAELPHQDVYGLSFSPDGQKLATGGWDSAVRFWDTSSGKAKSAVSMKERVGAAGDLRIYTVCWSPDGGLIATAHIGDGMVRVWRAEGMTLVQQFQVPSRFTFGALAFSPDGLWLAAGSQTGDVTLWDPVTGKLVWNLGRHGDSIYKLSFAPDNRTLLSGGSDGLCYLWKLRPPDAAYGGVLTWRFQGGDSDSKMAYRTLWGVTDLPDQGVGTAAQLLRPVTTVVDHARAIDIEEAERQEKQLRANSPDTMPVATVRRAIWVLEQAGTPKAVETLKELVAKNPQGDVAKFATAALARIAPRMQAANPPR
jgi:WD40 repeat protein/beta-lactamase regulating signal transducer with metallopeptidase domain